MEYIEIENVETGEVEVTKVVEIPTDIKSYKEFLAQIDAHLDDDSILELD
tara:strand:+ start:126 stop:275 length:150 start_codon:yes stop_codon:yes gene_type:complete